MVKKNIVLLLAILISLVLPSILSFDSQFYIAPAGDSQFVIDYTPNTFLSNDVNPPGITINNPNSTAIRQLSFILSVTTNEGAGCKYYLASNLTNRSLGTSNNLSHSVNVSSPSTGNDTVFVSCTDPLGNENITSKVFFIDTTGGGSNPGGATGDTIKLFSFKIYNKESWYYDEINAAFIDVFDIYEKLTVPDNVTYFFENITDPTMAINLGGGEYKVNYNASDRDITTLRLNVTVVEQGKVLNDVLYINLQERTLTSTAKDTVRLVAIDLEKYITDNWFMISIVALVIFAFVIVLVIVMRSSKHKP